MKYSVGNKPQKYKKVEETVANTGDDSLLLGTVGIAVVCEKSEICPSCITEPA